MRDLLNRKTWTMALSALVMAAVGLGAIPLPRALAQPQALAAPIVVSLNEGWTRLAWVPAVQGPLAFATAFISPDNTANLTLPALLTFTASAQVNCPRTGGDVEVNVKVYDFNQLILSQPYSVRCAFRLGPLDLTAIRKADDYLNDPHYLHVSGPIATGTAHNAVVVTDLATQDNFYWGFVRVDTAPGTPASTSRGAIAMTAVNPHATAWAGVQWGDPSDTHWFHIAPWFGALNQTEGRIAAWSGSRPAGPSPRP